MAAGQQGPLVRRICAYWARAAACGYAAIPATVSHSSGAGVLVYSRSTGGLADTHQQLCRRSVAAGAAARTAWSSAGDADYLSTAVHGAAELKGVSMHTQAQQFDDLPHHHGRPRSPSQPQQQQQHHPSPFHRQQRAPPIRPTWVPSSSTPAHYYPQETEGDSVKDVTGFITTQIQQATALGQLRRLLLRYKAQMEPEHVAVMLYALANLLHQNYPYPPDPLPQPPRTASNPAASPSDPHGVTSAQARAVWVPPPVPAPAQQLVTTMLGDLGSLAWHAIKGGEMAAEDIATVLCSWALMRWHPEPGLLAAAEAALLHTPCVHQLPPWALSRMVRGLGQLKHLTPAVLPQIAGPLEAALPYCTPQQLGDIALGLAGACVMPQPRGAPPAAAARQQQQHLLRAQQTHLLLQVLDQLALQLQFHLQAPPPQDLAQQQPQGYSAGPPAAQPATAAAAPTPAAGPAVWGAVEAVLRAVVAAGAPVEPHQLQAVEALLQGWQQRCEHSELPPAVRTLLQRIVVAA